MKLLKNQFLSASAQNAVQMVVRFVVGLLNMKVIALFVGPPGMALFGQLQNTLQIGSSLSGLGFTNGIIRYNSEYHHSPKKQQLFNSTSFTATLVSSIVTGIIIIIFAKELSAYLFKNTQYYLICACGGIYLLSVSFFNLVLAILNGWQKLRTFILLNLIQSISLLVFIVIATVLWHIEGMLWALILQSVFTAIASFWILIQLKVKISLHLSKIALAKLSSYSIITLASGILGPLALLLIRDIVIEQVSIQSAGIWEAINKVSNSYVIFVTGAFSYYFLPRFAKLKDNNEIRQEIISTYQLLIPLLLAGGVFLYFVREPLISIIYTKAFNEASSIIQWQFIGDTFRVLSWLIGYLLIAKARTKTFVITELISSLLQVLLTFILVKQIGLEGSTVAYCIENIIYFAMLYLIFHFNWGRKVSRE